MGLFDFDENLIKVTDFRMLSDLPDLFTFENGKKVLTADDWARRRAELFKTAVELQYGTVPPAPDRVEAEQIYEGHGERCQYRVTAFANGREVEFLLNIFLPKGVEDPPVVVDGDLCFGYAYDKEFINAFTGRGVALALFNRCELAHDIAAERTRTGQLFDAYPDHSFGAIAAWAWGYSRVVDALQLIGGFDMDCIAFTGHSRGGKTAMLAGVLDERAAIVCPNETNCGSCGCYRIHMSAETENGELRRSETLADMSKNYPEWLGPQMKDYAEKEGDLPFDCHFLKALVAPRTLIVAEAASDIWTNPVGSWLTSLAAKQVWQLLGCEENMLWYFRKGYHSHLVEDVGMLVSVINSKRRGDPVDTSDFFKAPFDTSAFDDLATPYDYCTGK